MISDKINKILFFVILISLLLFFTILNFRFYQEYPQIYTPTEEIETFTTSEISPQIMQEIFPTSSY